MGATAPIGLAAGVTNRSASMRFRTRSREKRAFTELHRLIGLLPHCHCVDEALRAVDEAFVTSLGLPLAIFSADDPCRVLEHTVGFVPCARDFDAARCAMGRGRILRRAIAGGSERRYFVPLATWKGAAGVLELASRRVISRGKWRIIRSFAGQTALIILRSALADEARHADLLSEADRFQKALLDSVAHNVRTPLASIIGVLGTLQEDHALTNAVRGDLIDTARQGADRLNRLLGNLLDFSRIEARSVQVRADPCDVQDVIGAALEHLGAAAREREIEVAIDADLPLVRMDFALIVQVLVNIIDNALKYSARETPIGIGARLTDGALEVRVEDVGGGLAEEDLVHIFDKFNRAGRTGETGGIGLGLSICRGLVEAHRGTIWAERRDPRGTTVRFRLPLSSGARQ